MNATQKIMKEIVILFLRENTDFFDEDLGQELSEEFNINKDFKSSDINENNIDEIYEFLENADYLQDIIYEFRESGEETDIEAEYSRHYESKSVAIQLDDGSWVGWTYWYGGGKHGNPEEIDWMDDAYDLKVVGEEIIKKTIFEKI